MLEASGEVTNVGLLNADQHFAHRRFRSQILTLQLLPPIKRVGCCWL
jgi:hypothetical protein